ncbi:MAG TPA: DUF3352 domain-containing protein [Solirubrobacteraceae bacterium]|nr:DUF3352 domain-containing protein [Solirubrobacteraceae bacterium]
MTELAPNSLRRRWAAVVVLLAALVIAGLAVGLSGGAAGVPPSASGTTAVIPADALAYVRLSLQRDSPAVRQSLAVAERLPNFGLAGTEVLGRLGEVLAGGRAVDLAGQVSPWAGSAAALALLNSPTSTAGSVVVVEVAHRRRAEAFVRGEGATGAGSYRGVALKRYANGSVLGFVGSDLVVGQPASVRRAIDVAAGSRPSLATAPAYRRAASGAPAGSVLSAYASAEGVRRVLAGQSGALGALGGLLSAPALQGTFLSVVPAAQGFRVQIHSAVGTTAGNTGFAPSLPGVIPANAALMLDVNGLSREMPQMLAAGSAAGVSSGLGSLLQRLGTALAGAGVNVRQIVSLFSGESAVAILGSGSAATLVVVTRAQAARAQAVFRQFQRAMARLVPTAGRRSRARSVYGTHRVAGIDVHEFQLTPTLQLDYGLVRGLLVVATNPRGIAELARPARSLAATPGFKAAFSGRPAQVTSLVYADLGQVLRSPALAAAGGTIYSRLLPDLEHLGGAGLTSARTAGGTTTELTIQIR